MDPTNSDCHLKDLADSDFDYISVGLRLQLAVTYIYHRWLWEQEVIGKCPITAFCPLLALIPVMKGGFWPNSDCRI